MVRKKIYLKPVKLWFEDQSGGVLLCKSFLEKSKFCVDTFKSGFALNLSAFIEDVPETVKCMAVKTIPNSKYSLQVDKKKFFVTTHLWGIIKNGFHGDAYAWLTKD